MYSNNDFRYYKGGDYLAHYGKKGMKWHKHLKATTNWWDTNVTGSTARSDMKREQKSYQLHSKIANENRSNFSAARRTVRMHIDPNTKSRKMWKMWTGSDQGNDYEAARRVAGHAKQHEGNAKHHGTEADNALKRYNKAKESYNSSLRGKTENAAKNAGRRLKTEAKVGKQKLKNLFKKKSASPAANVKKKNIVNEYKHIKNRFAKETRDENKQYAQLLKPQHKKLRKKLSKSYKPSYGGNVHNTILHNKVRNKRNNEKFGTNRMIRNNSR